MLGCDTDVVLDGAVLGKPADAAAARAMLACGARGARARVLSGLALLGRTAASASDAETAVRFRPLSETEIDAYVADRRVAGAGRRLRGPGLRLGPDRRVDGDSRT